MNEEPFGPIAPITRFKDTAKLSPRPIVFPMGLLPTLIRNQPRRWPAIQVTYAATWDSGEGAFLAAGRWNSRGVRAVYCSVDPATAILEAAVHKGFRALDTVPHVLTAITINPTSVFVVDPVMIPNPNWLRPGIPSGGQQAFGDDLLSRHKIVLIPSAVSTASWNLMFVGSNAAGSYKVKSQEPFALDPRLHPPAKP